MPGRLNLCAQGIKRRARHDTREEDQGECPLWSQIFPLVYIPRYIIFRDALILSYFLSFWSILNIVFTI